MNFLAPPTLGASRSLCCLFLAMASSFSKGETDTETEAPLMVVGGETKSVRVVGALRSRVTRRLSWACAGSDPGELILDVPSSVLVVVGTFSGSPAAMLLTSSPPK
ncbi:hypothetical protein V6N11_036028 [Hibiscus sabdariffa]|uniref:Secreted protein n=1 Tax=Hibiscus sabdariffa TaxID=183260 RepID=A0ABR2R983_9ROSI